MIVSMTHEPDRSDRPTDSVGKLGRKGWVDRCGAATLEVQAAQVISMGLWQSNRWESLIIRNPHMHNTTNEAPCE